MKIDLKELAAAVSHIQKNSYDASISIREDGRSIKLVCMSTNGSILEIEIFDEELSVHAKVRESKELIFIKESKWMKV